MKASPSLLAVLLLLSSTSLAQTAPVQETAPAQQAVPTEQAVPAQQAVPVQQAVPAQETAPTQQAVPVQETVPTQQAVPVQEAVPAQQAATAGESQKPEAAKPEAETQAATPSQSETATPATEAASADAVPDGPAVVFAPGAKIYLEPMDGFEKLLAQSIPKHKIPVVLVDEREKADFVMSGEAHLKKPGFITGTLFATPHGKGSISIKDARTGNEVFFYKFTRVDTDKTNYQVYEAWANSCAGHLKKAMKEKEKEKK